MTKEQFEQLQTMVLKSGQKLVEIEPNTWVDFESYRPKTKEELEALNSGVKDGGL